MAKQLWSTSPMIASVEWKKKQDPFAINARMGSLKKDRVKVVSADQ
jgi:hypothetical protein